MRLSVCTAAITCATLFATVIAAPTAESKPPAHTTLDYRAEELQRRANPGAKPGAKPGATKYFHEPGGGQHLGHYDRRYFHGIVSDQERTDTQLHMVRAYLTFFRENELDTWIAHGTLLGWWWNGKRLPWDFDLDTQVSDTTLNQLGESFNQTRYSYTSSDGKTTREFFLDVNPWIWERDRGDGMNVIDARWIDVRNGLFIDITGLSEIHPDTHPGTWSCKNYHLYKTTELYPMRETMFEGVRAKVPYEYDKILVDEYKETALISTEFNGHRWDSGPKEWVKTEETKKKEDKERKEKEEKEEEEKKKAAEKEEQEKKQALEQSKLD